MKLTRLYQQSNVKTILKQLRIMNQDYKMKSTLCAGAKVLLEYYSEENLWKLILWILSNVNILISKNGNRPIHTWKRDSCWLPSRSARKFGILSVVGATDEIIRMHI